MRSMRVDCGPVRIESWDELDATWTGGGPVGRSWPRCSAVPTRVTPTFGRLGPRRSSSRTSSATCARTGDGSHLLSAEDRLRLGVARRSSGRGRRPACAPFVARAGRTGARAVRRARSRRSRGAGLVRLRDPAGVRGLRPDPRSAWRRSAATCSGRRVGLRARDPRPRWRSARAHDAPGDPARQRPDAARGEGRRADLRRQLRRPRGRPRARPHRRRRLRARPLRDRRAGDLGVRAPTPWLHAMG